MENFSQIKFSLNIVEQQGLSGCNVAAAVQELYVRWLRCKMQSNKQQAFSGSSRLIVLRVVVIGTLLLTLFAVVPNRTTDKQYNTLKLNSKTRLNL